MFSISTVITLSMLAEHAAGKTGATCIPPAKVVYVSLHRCGTMSFHDFISASPELGLVPVRSALPVQRRGQPYKGVQ
jgi:hypothetical protein